MKITNIHEDTDNNINNNNNINYDLSGAAANGSLSTVEFLLEKGIDINEPGKDGTTPLCAAALWGNEKIVLFLLSKGANINAENEGTKWTALHACTFQEHGRIVRILLEAKANMYLNDNLNRTPIDFASVSEAIWPFFASFGCQRSNKMDLISKGIIRKVSNQQETNITNNISNEFSRPGSAYIRTEYNPFQQVLRKNSDPAMGSNKNMKHIIDPLADDQNTSKGVTRRISLGSLRL